MEPNVSGTTIDSPGIFQNHGLFLVSAGSSYTHTVPLIIGLCTASLLLLHYFIVEPLFFGPLSHVPGPKFAAISWYYLSYYDIRLRRNKTITRWHEKYGPVIRIRPSEISVSDPSDFREVYSSKSGYDKSTFFQRFRLYNTDNLFSTVSYSQHQAQKRKIAPSYTKSTVDRVAEPFVRERVQTLLSQISKAPNGVVDFLLTWDCYTLDNITRYLYGAPHGSSALETTKDRALVSKMRTNQLWMPISFHVPQSLHGSFLLRTLLPADYTATLATASNVKSYLLSFMSAQEADPDWSTYPSVFRTMREARDTIGNPLSREYMATEIFDHIKAGEQTTASSLTFTAWRLSRHAEWQRRLRDEVRAVAVEEPGTLSAYRDVEKLPVLDAVVRESLRVHPVSSGRSERVVPRGGRVYQGFAVPEGTTVMGTNLAVLSDPAVFPDPGTWNPQRWIDADPVRMKEMERSYVPFGYGARICIGMHLAILEIKLGLVGLYGRFSTSLTESCTDESMEQLGTFTAVPRALRCELLVKEE